MSEKDAPGKKDPERFSGIECFQSARHAWIQEQGSVDVWIAARPEDLVGLEAMR
jgi:hypothetical protein